MLILPNGDKWIVDNKEWQDAGISYSDACKCKIPETSYEEFIADMLSNKRYIPHKHTITKTFPNGYWDANFDPFSEVFEALAVVKRRLPWSNVFILPNKKVYVVYMGVESNEEECGYEVKVYNNVDEYNNIIALRSW